MSFLPAILLVYYSVRKELQNIVLLLFSLLFYAWGEPIYVFLMLFLFSLTIGSGYGLIKDKYLIQIENSFLL